MLKTEHRNWAGGVKVHRKFRLLRWNVTVSTCKKRGLWDRFGGGWKWSLGVRVGGSTVLIDCLTFTVSITGAKHGN